jgi:hypothetical protein
MPDSGSHAQLPSVLVALQDPQGPIDSLQIEETASGTVRISGWSQGKMLTHPLEINERELIRLLQKAIRARVLSEEFLSNLRSDFEI